MEGQRLTKQAIAAQSVGKFTRSFSSLLFEQLPAIGANFVVNWDCNPEHTMGPNHYAKTRAFRQVVSVLLQ